MILPVEDMYEVFGEALGRAFDKLGLDVDALMDVLTEARPEVLAVLYTRGMLKKEDEEKEVPPPPPPDGPQTAAELETGIFNFVVYLVHMYRNRGVSQEQSIQKVVDYLERLVEGLRSNKDNQAPNFPN